MKRVFLYCWVATALFTSCSPKDEKNDPIVQEDVVFFASLEQPEEVGTKVFADKTIRLRWNAGDCVSIFKKNTYNQKYDFIGETGDFDGGFNKVDNPEFMTGQAITHVISVYPYQRETMVSENGVIKVTLPSEQHYLENTFGLGVNTMVSVSSDDLLQYKNVGGYLILSLYGEDFEVSSIILKGNNGEKLAGDAYVSMPLKGTPTVTMSNEAATEITLVCDTPIALGATAEEVTQFWIVVPPVSFSKGFTIIVKDPIGHCFEKTMTNRSEIVRNKLSRSSLLKVEIEKTQLNNEIWYTTIDEKPVVPYIRNNSEITIVSNKYVKGQGVIAFDRDVSELWDSAFYDCPSLTSVSIPSSVTSIGRTAFGRCSNLASISIPSGVTSIGDGAFSGCSALSSIMIPSSITSIGKACFSSCNSLQSINIPLGVTTIEDSSFSNCKGLTSISIPSSVTSIENRAFRGCSCLKTLDIPSSVKRIGSGAFDNCRSLTSIKIPSGVTSIENETFYYCSSLESIDIPDSVTSIGVDAFICCKSLKSIKIPLGVTSIERRTFSGCSDLESISIPSSVKKIGSQAFMSCSSLTSMSIPSGVTIIEDETFVNCSSLTTITIPSSVTSFGNQVFFGCSSLTSITIPFGVTRILDLTFYGCTSLKSIMIPSSVTSIGQSAFSRCSNLTSISIPSGVTSIGSDAFYGCMGLRSITIKRMDPPKGGDYMFEETNDAPIFVPTGSVDKYKKALFWKDYADRIRAAS